MVITWDLLQSAQCCWKGELETVKRCCLGFFSPSITYFMYTSLNSPVCLADMKSIGVLTYNVHCTVNFIFYTGGQEIVRSNII